MIVPKFGFEHDGVWCVHWPKDQSHVTHAGTKKLLVSELATWLQELGRVGNKGKHVKPDCEAALAEDSRAGALSGFQKAQQKSIEDEAATQRAIRKDRRAYSSSVRDSAERESLIQELSHMPIRDQLVRISIDEIHAPTFYPTRCAASADLGVIRSLSEETREALVNGLKGKHRGPWGAFKKRLLQVCDELDNNSLMK